MYSKVLRNLRSTNRYVERDSETIQMSEDVITGRSKGTKRNNGTQGRMNWAKVSRGNSKREHRQKNWAGQNRR